MNDWLTKELLITWGPLGLGWPLFFWAVRRLIAEQENRHALAKEMMRSFAAVEKALVHLTVLLEERVPQRRQGKGGAAS